MKSFVEMTADEREVYCLQAAELLETPLPPAVIEKDFWVCWALSMLLEIPVFLGLNHPLGQSTAPQKRSEKSG